MLCLLFEAKCKKVKGISDKRHRKQIRQRLLKRCEGGLLNYLGSGKDRAGAFVVREHGRGYALRFLDYKVRIAGFFTSDNTTFVAIDWFKKEQDRNSEAQNALYRRADDLAKSGEYEELSHGH